MSVLRLLLVALLMMVVLSRSIPVLTLGRWSKAATLPPAVDRHIKNKHKELIGARAVDIQSQVASGTNYKITYQGATIRALVEISHQPWNNAFKETSYRVL